MHTTQYCFAIFPFQGVTEKQSDINSFFNPMSKAFLDWSKLARTKQNSDKSPNSLVNVTLFQKNHSWYPVWQQHMYKHGENVVPKDWYNAHRCTETHCSYHYPSSWRWVTSTLGKLLNADRVSLSRPRPISGQPTWKTAKNVGVEEC